MVRLTDRPDMTLDVYRGRKTTVQQQQQQSLVLPSSGSAIVFAQVVRTFSGRVNVSEF